MKICSRALAVSIALIGIATLDLDSARAQGAEDPNQAQPSQQEMPGPAAAELDAMVAEIGATLRCPVCRQQSVAESSARISREMQGIIRSMLIDGKTPEEIEAYFVESYGPWILLRPKAEGANLFVYLGPLGAFLLGGLLLAVRLRKTGREIAAAEATPERNPDTAANRDSAADHVGEEDRDWLDAALRGS